MFIIQRLANYDIMYALPVKKTFKRKKIINKYKVGDVLQQGRRRTLVYVKVFG